MRREDNYYPLLKGYSNKKNKNLQRIPKIMQNSLGKIKARGNLSLDINQSKKIKENLALNKLSSNENRFQTSSNFVQLDNDRIYYSTIQSNDYYEKNARVKNVKVSIRKNSRDNKSIHQEIISKSYVRYEASPRGKIKRVNTIGLVRNQGSNLTEGNKPTERIVRTSDKNTMKTLDLMRMDKTNRETYSELFLRICGLSMENEKLRVRSAKLNQNLLKFS